MSKENIIVLDTETTGFHAFKGDELLQVSIINGDGDTLYNRYFKPAHTTDWSDAAAVNGITADKVKDCPAAVDCVEEISEIVGSADVVVGYNTQFDLGFLRSIGCKPKKSAKVVDVMADFAPIYGEWNYSRNDWKWQKLSKCAAYFDYDWGDDTAHDSLSDCRATLFCWKQICHMKEAIS